MYRYTLRTSLKSAMLKAAKGGYKPALGCTSLYAMYLQHRASLNLLTVPNGYWIFQRLHNFVFFSKDKQSQIPVYGILIPATMFDRVRETPNGT